MVNWPPCPVVRTEVPDKRTFADIVKAVHEVFGQAIVVEGIVVTATAVTVKSVLGKEEVEARARLEVLNSIEVPVKRTLCGSEVSCLVPLVKMGGKRKLTKLSSVERGCLVFPITGNPIWPIVDENGNVGTQMHAGPLDGIHVEVLEGVPRYAFARPRRVWLVEGRDAPTSRALVSTDLGHHLDAVKAELLVPIVFPISHPYRTQYSRSRLHRLVRHANPTRLLSQRKPHTERPSQSISNSCLLA